ncbi:MFS general substrate transporter [Pseudovirgaria hyperparasitica]|uniref:MFS general substrate transporter n=1 Tax=Pseudovirgaria hyperparasitica TaxID=470096 RepID=A0A6A6VQT4_9PEZI|nr:MFS general substrate transporter [Pseudovirgaria hyperparasitica]KAF2753018.1 MFS general substrate transporter [Pseudovirgaria hyperparasitica]
MHNWAEWQEKAERPTLSPPARPRRRTSRRNATTLRSSQKSTSDRSSVADSLASEIDKRFSLRRDKTLSLELPHPYAEYPLERTSQALRLSQSIRFSQVLPNHINWDGNFLESSALEEQPPDAKEIAAASDFPDGGRAAWTVVAGGFLCLFCSFGWMICIGVFQDYYSTTLLSQYDSSTIAWIPSTQSFMMFFGAPFFGKIFDSYGPRPLLIGGTFFHVFGIMMTSLSTQYYQVFLAQSVVSGLGASALFYAGNNSAGTWFLKRRALALGIVSSGSSVGGVIIPVIIQNIIGRVGFPWTMRTVGFIYLFLLCIANLTVRSRLNHTPKPFRVMEFFRPLALRTPALVASASFFFFLGVFVPYNFLLVQARALRLPSNISENIISILNATSVVGRILPAYLGDKFGRFNAMITTTFLCVIFAFALWIPANGTDPIVAFACLYGFSSGAFVAMIPALVAQISDVSEIGVRLGTNMMVVSLAALTGNPISGALITANNGGFLYLQVFCGLTLFVGGCLFIAARASETRKVFTRM